MRDCNNDAKLLLTIPFLAMLAPVASRTDDTAPTPSAAQVLAELRARRDSLENWEIEAAWEEYEGGQPSGWEVQTVWRDNMGRIRCRYYHGSGPLPSDDEASEKGRMVDDAYDGELTVNLIDNPARNRLGDPLTADEAKADPENRYRIATIHEGVFPAKGGLKSHRDPMTAVDEAVIDQLSELLAAGKAVTVERVSGEQGVHEIRYQLDLAHDPHRLEHRVLVDGDKGWVVTRHEQFFPNGKSARRKTCEYRPSAYGIWLPTKGQFLNFWGGDVPDLDWRFTVRRAVANNPQFEQSVFDVTLQPGYYVTDTRSHVSYRVGEQPLSSAGLARPAQEAVAVKSDAGRSNGPREKARANWVGRMLIGATTLVLIVVVVVVLRKRTSRQGSKQASR